MGLLISCAIPAVSWPREAIFSDSTSLACACFKFTRASSHYLKLASTPTFSGTDLTLEYWIYPTGTSAEHEGIFSLSAYDGTGANPTAQRFEFDYNNDNISIYHSTSNWQDTGADKNPNTWEHHAWVADGSGEGKVFFYTEILIKLLKLLSQLWIFYIDDYRKMKTPYFLFFSW